jgi:hypothetical protein
MGPQARVAEQGVEVGRTPLEGRAVVAGLAMVRGQGRMVGEGVGVVMAGGVAVPAMGVAREQSKA